MIIKNKPIQVPDYAIGVIFAGGFGTRLWPVSTEKIPKQINPAFFNETLLVTTYKRSRQIFKKENIYLVITKNLFSKIMKLIDLPVNQILVQPENADTAMAEGFAAVYLKHKRPECVAVTLYSDHLVSTPQTFFKAIEKSVRVAGRNHVLVTVGTIPTSPSTDFGYIELGDEIDGTGAKVFQVNKFVEKPDLGMAETMLKSNKFVWNTGLYVWEPWVLLSIFEKTAPDISAKLDVLEREFGRKSFVHRLKQLFRQVRKVPFDKAVSEKNHSLVVVVADIHWQDVGNWKTIYELAGKDKNGHAVLGNPDAKIASIDSSNCLIIHKQKHLALIGVKDLIVVEAGDDLLICHQDYAHKVKQAVKLLE